MPLMPASRQVPGMLAAKRAARAGMAGPSAATGVAHAAASLVPPSPAASFAGSLDARAQGPPALLSREAQLRGAAAGGSGGGSASGAAAAAAAAYAAAAARTLAARAAAAAAAASLADAPLRPSEAADGGGSSSSSILSGTHSQARGGSGAALSAPPASGQMVLDGVALPPAVLPTPAAAGDPRQRVVAMMAAAKARAEVQARVLHKRGATGGS